MTARCTGAAPRWRGSSDACTLMRPSGGVSSTAAGRILPYAATTPRIRAARPEGGEERLVLQPLRLQHRDAVLARATLLDRAFADLLAAAARPVGLRDDADDGVARGEQRLQRRHGEVRRAEEHEAERAAGAVTICPTGSASGCGGR